MRWEQHFKGESGDAPATAREAAKAFLRTYVVLGWEPEYFPRRASGHGWDAQIGGVVKDGAGQRFVSDQQIAITRPSFAIYELAEIIAEIRREEGLEPEPAGYCLSCGAPLSAKEGAGRDRLFCNNNNRCKQAYHRKMQREQKREEILEENAALQDTWGKHHIGGPLLTLLQEILIEQGQEAAQKATDAVLDYASEQAKQAEEEIKQLEHTIRILKHELDLEYRYFRDTQARGLIAFLRKQDPTPLIQKILAAEKELPPTASHWTYESTLRRKQICSEEELKQFKDIWKLMMLEASEEYLDA